ncbi:MAG: polyprenol monophosphomannose synthase [Flavobacteriaceae bacterium]|jgi:dolichol-phosphate mannosyltransferase
MKKTLVVIPTFNEVENIQKAIETTLGNQSFDVLVVDDSSPDGTANLVLKLMESNPNRLFLEQRARKEGLGKAYLHGFKWALKKKYDYIFEMDADLSHDPKELPLMLTHLKSGFDMVIGSRYSKGINVVNWPLSRILLSYLASLYVRWITSMPIKDPTAGFVGYKREVLEQLDLEKIKFVGYAFQIEMKFKVWKKGLKYIEHPIVFTNRTMGVSKMNGKIIWEALPAVLILRISSIFNRI